ncbi:MAG: hypothetical protein HY319_32000 [Armatimonadetes bacterium]|nr:hypothetical protein [Armatimonadota bacterium]
MSNAIPGFAKPYIESFKQNGSLPGQGYVRQGLSSDDSRSADAEISQQFDQFRQGDNQPGDADPALGRIHAPGAFFGADLRIEFEGDSKSGSSVFTLGESGQEPVMAVVSEFGAQAVDMIAVAKEESQVQATAVHIDREHPENSFAVGPKEVFEQEGLGTLAMF